MFIGNCQAPLKFLFTTYLQCNDEMKACLRHHPEVVLIATSNHPNPTGELRGPSAYRDAKSCAAATRQLLALPQRPTAILFPDDFSAIGGIQTIREEGLLIPLTGVKRNSKICIHRANKTCK